MTDESVRKSWWFFYPIMGLELSDRKHSILNPYFKDATVVSKGHIKNIVEMMNFKKNKVHQKDITFMLQNAMFDEEFSSFIAVRRSGEPRFDERNPQILREATKRAKEISSLLGIVLLDKHKYNGTCGLVEQLHKKTRSLAILEFDQAEFQFRTGGRESFLFEAASEFIKMSSKEMIKLLSSDSYRNYSNIIINYKSTTNSIRNSIVQSSIRLSYALHSNDLSSQLLGAVTCLEILLTEQGDSYELTKKRIKALIGQAKYDQFLVDDVFNSRHLYVHRGYEVEDSQLAHNAIKLSTSVILEYSDLCFKGFLGKKSITDYLDFVYLANIYSNQLDESKQNKFKQIYLKHYSEK